LNLICILKRKRGFSLLNDNPEILVYSHFKRKCKLWAGKDLRAAEEEARKKEAKPD